MSDKPMGSLMPALYSHRLHDIQKIVASCGYALAVHGSMQRDLDLVAIPWTKAAGEPEELVSRLSIELCLERLSSDPAKKPHGRLAYTLMMGGACFMDLSVMPRSPAQGGRDDD